ncbi:MAG TPA: hypothetical protein VHR36_05115 [Pyrinomonadaceae bacterium]|jgi:hypothetical protein|nr:hypothetical protein [Pyrinomonadaceae bacterium]
MNSKYLKKKIGGAVMGLSLLAGVGITAATTAQAQWPSNPQIQRTRTYDPYRDPYRTYDPYQVQRNRQYRNRNWRYNNSGDNYPNYGGSFDLRQTALNAGYNNGMEAGRRDRQRGAYYNINSQREFQRASKDYSSRLGDRNLYAEYFRLAFQRGYNDGYQGL